MCGMEEIVSTKLLTAKSKFFASHLESNGAADLLRLNLGIDRSERAFRSNSRKKIIYLLCAVQCHRRVAGDGLQLIKELLKAQNNFGRHLIRFKTEIAELPKKDGSSSRT